MSKQNKKIKLLYAIIDRYHKDGKTKNKYKKVGVEVTDYNDDGSEYSYILIERDVNFAGFPDFSGKENNTTVLVTKFEPTEENKDEFYAEGEVF